MERNNIQTDSSRQSTAYYSANEEQGREVSQVPKLMNKSDQNKARGLTVGKLITEFNFKKV